MRVDDFSLFFGPRLLRLGKRNGTEYNIRSVPLGGFVKIAGMEPEDAAGGTTTLRVAGTGSFLIGLDEERLAAINAENVSERIREAVDQAVGETGKLAPDSKEDLQALLLTTSLTEDEHRYIELVLEAGAYQPDPDGYNQKPLWQRAVVIFAGPFMSLFFGYALFCVMGFTTGLPSLDQMKRPKLLAEIGQLVPGEPAEKAGLKAGDKIIAIDGEKITDEQRMVDIIHSSAGKLLHMTVDRDKKSLAFEVTPVLKEQEVTEDGKTVKRQMGLIGFTPAASPPDWIRYTPLKAVAAGSTLIYEEVTQTLQGVFSRHVRDNVGGIYTIAVVIHQESKEGLGHILFTAAMLSVSLGIMNLFPIPVLDGGHLLLLSIEGIRRRRLSSREVYGAQMVGICIIGVLFVLVMYNDILRSLSRN